MFLYWKDCYSQFKHFCSVIFTIMHYIDEVDSVNIMLHQFTNIEKLMHVFSK